MAAGPIRKKAQDEAPHAASPQEQGRPTRRRMRPPLTPMIDVTFQLLLFFLLTMQFRQAEGQVPQQLPKEAGDRPGSVIPLAIPIRIDVLAVAEPDKRVHLRITYPSGRPITLRKSLRDEPWQELLGRLRSRLGDHPGEGEDVPVVIHPAARAAWEHSFNAFYQAKQAGYRTVTWSASGHNGGGDN